MRWLGCAGKDALVRMRFLSLNRTGSTPDDALVRAPPLHDALVRLRFLSLNRLDPMVRWMHDKVLALLVLALDRS